MSKAKTAFSIADGRIVVNELGARVCSLDQFTTSKEEALILSAPDMYQALIGALDIVNALSAERSPLRERFRAEGNAILQALQDATGCE